MVGAFKMNISRNEFNRIRDSLPIAWFAREPVGGRKLIASQRDPKQLRHNFISRIANDTHVTAAVAFHRAALKNTPQLAGVVTDTVQENLAEYIAKTFHPELRRASPDKETLRANATRIASLFCPRPVRSPRGTPD